MIFIEISESQRRGVQLNAPPTKLAELSAAPPTKLAELSAVQSGGSASAVDLSVGAFN